VCAVQLVPRAAGSLLTDRPPFRVRPAVRGHGLWRAPDLQACSPPRRLPSPGRRWRHHPV